MSLAQLQVFSDYLEAASTEVLTQQVNLFNAATKGAIVLRNGSNRGDFTFNLKYQLLSGLVRERDAYSDAPVASKDLVRIMEGSVKLGRGAGPINIDQGLWDWIGRSPEEAGAAIGQQLAPAILAEKLNTALLAFVSATLNVGSTLVHDYSGSGKLDLSVLVDGTQKLGDRSNQISCWVMNSKCWFDLVKDAITNSTNLFTFGTIQVMNDGLGRPFVITDSDNLVDTPKYYTLGLTPLAIVVEDNGAMRTNTELKNGYTNIKSTYQAQWDYNLGMKGYLWDEANGGACPNNAAIGSGSNWIKTASSVKDMAGVLVVSQ